jgi:hypothetical protein
MSSHLAEVAGAGADKQALAQAVASSDETRSNEAPAGFEDASGLLDGGRCR